MIRVLKLCVFVGNKAWVLHAILLTGANLNFAATLRYVSPYSRYLELVYIFNSDFKVETPFFTLQNISNFKRK
jgi:hypothetical protein